MAFKDLEHKECLCDFVQNLGSFKDTFSAFIDAAVAILTTIKATMQLWPADIGDQLRKLEYEGEIAALELIMAPVEAPFAMVGNYMRPYSDCPPVANAAKTLDGAKNYVIGPLKEAKQKLNDYIAALNLASTKIDQLDSWIEFLNSLKESLDTCGQT